MATVSIKGLIAGTVFFLKLLVPSCHSMPVSSVWCGVNWCDWLGGRSGGAATSNSPTVCLLRVTDSHHVSVLHKANAW